MNLRLYVRAAQKMLSFVVWDARYLIQREINIPYIIKHRGFLNYSYFLKYETRST